LLQCVDVGGAARPVDGAAGGCVEVLLWCGAVCSVCCSVLRSVGLRGLLMQQQIGVLQCCCIVVHCGAVCCSLLQCVDGGAAWVADEAADGCVAVLWCGVLWFDVVQCDAVCCNVLTSVVLRGLLMKQQMRVVVLRGAHTHTPHTNTKYDVHSYSLLRGVTFICD